MAISPTNLSRSTISAILQTCPSGADIFLRSARAYDSWSALDRPAHAGTDASRTSHAQRGGASATGTAGHRYTSASVRHSRACSMRHHGLLLAR